jgi:4-hydroxybutyryl-CoA dehydratase/vinylacetyl-CoA-Delta-isomerase
MKSASDYRNSLYRLKRNAYIMGKLIDEPNVHPLIIPSVNAVAATYEFAMNPDYSDIMTAFSPLVQKRVNRFTHLFGSKDDLVAKVKMLRFLGSKTACCFQRCVGMDALNALDSTTFDIDMALDTAYHKRFRGFLAYVQENDLVCSGAMTDPKGNRSLKPHQQKDSDLFLRVVRKEREGIVVRGAKCHQTGALNAHEIIVMPTLALTEYDRDYAVSFAVPTDTPGITYILGRQPSDTRRFEQHSYDSGNLNYGGHEAMVIFDDVFVPWERVFMCGEHQYAGMLVERFASYHRQSYGGCKVGVGDVLIGAATLAVESIGVSRASHIKDKLIEMIHLNETMYACGIACSAEGSATSSGTFMVDELLANVCKLNVTRFPYEISRMAEDLAGGLLVTMPSCADANCSGMSEAVNKYLQGSGAMPTNLRLKILRLIENLTLGQGAVAYRTESMHGAGSPQAQRVMIWRRASLENKKNAALDIVSRNST